MNKEEIIKHLRLYPELKKAVASGRDFVVYKKYRKNFVVGIDERIHTLLEIIDDFILNERSKEVMMILTYHYFGKKTDVATIKNMYVSPSTYYRIKEKIVNKLFNLCISKKLVPYDLLLQDPILQENVCDCAG